MIRVLIVDDQPVVRAGVARILGPDDGFEVVAECDDGDEVKETVAEQKPDVVLMDVRMRRMDGVTATRALAESGDAPPVLILTTFDDDDALWGAIEAGAPVRSATAMSAADARRALPRGPHGLSREEVELSQRARLLQAATEAVAEQGYVKTTVADFLARAGVSRATFYRLFRDREDCFQAAYRANADLVAAAMTAELDQVRASGELDPLARLDRVLGVYLSALRSAPALARVFLVEVYAAGPTAIEQRRASLERFVDIVAETHRGETGVLGTKRSQRFAAQAFVGAVSSLVTNAVGVGDTDMLLALREPLMRLAAQITRKS